MTLAFIMLEMPKETVGIVRKWVDGTLEDEEEED
jgi:hypothetical protein